MDRSSAAAAIAKVARLLHARGWIANHDGNVSVRLRQADRFLITPTAVSKAEVDPGMLIVVDGAGKVVQGRRKAFSELALHLAVFRARPDVHAVVHAHPPTASAYGLTDSQDLSCPTMPEVVVSLGPTIPTVPYALPGTPEWSANLAPFLEPHDAVLLAGNGALTWGPELDTAYLRMELVEHYATIMAAARALGPVRALPSAHVQKLLESRRKAGLGPEGRRDKAAAAEVARVVRSP